MGIRRSEVGRPVIDLNPPPGRYALQQFKESPYKVGSAADVGHRRRAEALALNASLGWLFGDNPFKMGAILKLTDDSPEPPYNFAMGARRPSTFGLGLAAAGRRKRR